ncbi:hypothetical protein AB0K00_26710 [Dactylosporangium sp. NPDC049525]|uniref:hypothetical protein n=1 Tax=Dactylosporangium sp. NPDC049525 TaxID=3154730 RepID=UPI003437D451
MAERKKLLLRLDPQVYDAVARWAADDLRSVNAQIEFALRLALRQVGRPARASPADPADPSDADLDDPSAS